MPKVSVAHKSSKPAPEAMALIKVFFETDADLRRLDPKMTCQFSADSLSGKVHSSQFKADISIASEAGGSHITINVDLPLLLTPFKGKVEETLKRKLSKHLA